VHSSMNSGLPALNEPQSSARCETRGRNTQRFSPPNLLRSVEHWPCSSLPISVLSSLCFTGSARVSFGPALDAASNVDWYLMRRPP